MLSRELSWLSRTPSGVNQRLMPVVDQLFLNPFEKWSRYGRFPYTFLLHLLLLAVVTLQAVLLFDRDVQHVSRTVRHFAHLFVGSYTTAYGQSVTFHERLALQQAFSRAVHNHFFINDMSIVNFKLVNPASLVVDVRWRNGTVDPTTIEFSGFAKPNASEADAEAYLRSTVPFLYDNRLLPQVAMISMEHAFREIGYVPGARKAWVVDCAYHWNVQTIFDGRQAGEFLGRVVSQASDCQGVDWHPMHAVHLVCLGLAIVGLFLILRKFWRSSRMVNTLRANTDVWERLSWKDLFMLFSGWWAVAIVMHAIQIVSCTVCLNSVPDIAVRFQSVGFSCFLTWLNMCQYFESFPGYYMAFHTLGISAGRVLRFLCSVGPLFIGFVLLGVCLFWRSSFFESPGAAAASLFSLMNGDMIHDSFEEVYGIGGLVAHFFLYAFLMLFTYVILNVNISIVTDAYERAKRHPQRENAKLLRQHLREAAGERRASPHVSPAPSPPESPRCGRSASFGPELSDRSARLDDQPVRRPSRPLQGYMSPRFFQSERIQEALAITFPEESLLGNDSLAAGRAGEAGAGGPPSVSSSSVISGLDVLAAPAQPGASGRATEEDLEMTAVPRGWEDFDRLFVKVQDGVAELKRLPLPACGDVAGRQVGARLEDLDRAAQSVAAARKRAGLQVGR